MTISELLTQRFTDAITKSFKPRPLIGPKWFIFSEAGKPAHFQFLGCSKLAKATIKNPAAVAQRLLRNLDLKDLQAEVKVTDDAKILVNFPQGLPTVK